MRIGFYGAAQGVTGSCFLVEAAGKQLLLDCGLFQGSKAEQERNYRDFPLDPAAIDAVVLTHAHIDHSGLLPKLVRHGFAGPILATEPTRDLCDIMLADSAHIQEMEVERQNRKRRRAGEPMLEPIYTVEDARRCLERFRVLPFHERREVAPGFAVTLYHSGHILGSAIIEVWVEENGVETGLVFSGDLGGGDRPIVPEAEGVSRADFIVMESTYGHRARESEPNRYEKLAAIVRETLARGGNVIIPAFAVERTQDVLYSLNRLIHDGQLQAEHVYVDSPLATEATDIFCRHVEEFDEEGRAFAQAVGSCPLYFKQLAFSRATEESIALNKIKSGAVIIAASGMCEAGRIKHHLKHNLWRPECSVVFVGYQAAGTLGRQIVDGRERVRVHSEEIAVRAQVHNLEGFSAHAGQAELLDWAVRVGEAPRGLFLVHGETEAQTALRDLLQDRIQAPVMIPEYAAVYELDEEARLAVKGIPREQIEREAALLESRRTQG